MHPYRPFRYALMALVAACATSPPPPPPPPPAPTFVFPHAHVWTAEPRVPLRTDTAVTVVRRPLTRLAVLDADSSGLTVRCEACPGEPAGRVAHRDVIYEPMAPDEAALGSLTEFALAVRAAAEAGDTAALRPVMAAGFTFSLIGRQGVPEALTAWRSERLQSIGELPTLLDRGLATADSVLWAAPPEFLETAGYQGLRAGFRRSRSGRWEWLFLIRGTRI